MKIKVLNKKIKAVLFLFCLFVYALTLVFFLNKNENSVEYTNKNAQTELVSMANNLEYREITELEKVEIVADESQEVLSVIDNVKKFFMGRCQADVQIEAPQLFCGGSGPKSDSDIRLAEIYAPDVLFAGAAAPFDNIVLTSNPAGRISFRNGSEIIDPENDYLINMPPLPDGNPGEPRKNLLSEELKKDPYEMHYEVVGHIEEVEFDIHPEEKSLCPDVVNGGQFNVKGSNQLQKDLTGSVTPPGLMTLGNRDVSARLCRDDVRTIHLDEDESFLLCHESIWQKFRCDAIKIFKDPKACENIHGIVIDAPLGSGEVCNEEDCSVRYTEAGRILTSPPNWADILYPSSLTGDERENDYIVDDPVILTTPCKVRVDCEICPTVCIWDISMWQHVFDLEKVFTFPGYKTAFEEDEYWEGVEHEIKLRGRLGTQNFY